MNIPEMFNLGNQFYNEGRVETAMDVWNKVIAADANFGPVHLQQHNVFRSQGNLFKARESLMRFLNCPVTGMTVDAIPAIRQQLAELEKQINPQPPK
jgi:Tfp pilus assembly protein PilF